MKKKYSIFSLFYDEKVDINKSVYKNLAHKTRIEKLKTIKI